MIETTSADGTAIAADRTGSGPALVLVAPALATRAAFGPLAELLAPHFTVYAYDRRGRGHHRPVHDRPATADPAMVEGHHADPGPGRRGESPVHARGGQGACRHPPQCHRHHVPGPGARRPPGDGRADPDRVLPRRLSR